MRNDLELIVHKLSTDLQEIRIYAMGDLHIGSPDFNAQLFDAWLKKVTEDDYAKVVILGDMLDNGLKNSKTNVYDAPIRPREQKEWRAHLCEEGYLAVVCKGAREAIRVLCEYLDLSFEAEIVKWEAMRERATRGNSVAPVRAARITRNRI